MSALALRMSDAPHTLRLCLRSENPVLCRGTTSPRGVRPTIQIGQSHSIQNAALLARHANLVDTRRSEVWRLYKTRPFLPETPLQNCTEYSYSHVKFFVTD